MAEDQAMVPDRRYEPTKADMEADISVPVSPERLARALFKGGAERREKSKDDP